MGGKAAQPCRAEGSREICRRRQPAELVGADRPPKRFSVCACERLWRWVWVGGMGWEG